MYTRLKRLVIGAPIASNKAEHEKLNVPLGLAVFAADALSSTAYATDEILLALAAAGTAIPLGLIALPVAIAILLLITVVVLSYRQIIRAYPDGGGSYVVARQNLGVLPSHIAAAALLIDYVLTVAVSISAGVAALTSTGLFPHSSATALCILLTLVIMFVNLRGVKESGVTFAVPAYVFLLSMALLIGGGIWRIVTTTGLPPIDIGHLTSAFSSVGPAHDASALSWGAGFGFSLLFLKAFSHGCAGLTGIEAVSNGVKAFREPRSVMANRTMTLMGMLLGSIFLGITFLAFAFQIVPKEGETILSQVAGTVFGHDTFSYLLVQFSTMLLLILAANTAFNGFPQVASLLAGDGFLPRQLMSLGDRLVFNNGIIILAFLAALLILLYGGDTHALIPLYAVGVFVSFTLSQAGMVRYHRDNREPGWRSGLWINMIGAIVTAIVTLILAIEKFEEGAWIVLLAMPILILFFRVIARHYRTVARQLSLPVEGYCPNRVDHTVLVLVSSLHRATIPALEYAKSISERVEAVHVCLNPEGTERLKKAWAQWGCGITLTVLPSPYRSLLEPVLDYIDEVEVRDDQDLLTIIVPEFVPKRWWHNLLHNQTAWLLKAALRTRPGKVVTTVRYHLEA